MSAALEETSVTYEELADIERQFDDAEIEIIRHQFELTRPIYEKRQKTVQQIPNFWPLVVEQAPPEIDEYIQPSDSMVLLSSLTSVSVDRFELDDNARGEPRSFSVKLGFSENDHFEDAVIEKKFWHRRGPNGWSGLCSEPVEIKWKKGKDLTGGMLGLAIKVWEEDKAWAKSNPGEKRKTATEARKALKDSLNNTGLGGISFFAWFGYIGEAISAEESQKETERRKLGAAARLTDGVDGAAKVPKAEVDGDEDDDENDSNLDLEIFPEGDTLAYCIAEDLWPGAIKYFTQAQEQDALSDASFEDSDDDDDMGESQLPLRGGDGERPSKRGRHE